MSIFSGEFDTLPWLQEKTLRALQAAVVLVDIANEPDTSQWYKRNLLDTAESIISRLAPVVAFMYLKEGAAQPDAWGGILEGGSFALGAWCKKWQIADPHDFSKGALKHLRTVDEDEEKAVTVGPVEFEGDIEQGMDLKLQIYSSLSRRLLYEQVAPEAHRLLLFLMGKLWLSDAPDIVCASKKFLPTDIGLTIEQAADAYRQLYESGFLERVDKPTDGRSDDRLYLRLVIVGVNDSRHPPQFEEEVFGFPGSRIDGKVTSGQMKFVPLDETAASILNRWFKTDQSLTELRDFLQAEIGASQIYVEKAEVNYGEQGPKLLVSYRYPLDAEYQVMDKIVSELSQRWLKRRLVSSQSD